uniref:Uncharacterized protein n=1 Tax=Rhizophora mucronata TaxID=61149 RepID=A0A2P2KQZ1_RHIMU
MNYHRDAIASILKGSKNWELSRSTVFIPQPKQT